MKTYYVAIMMVMQHDPNAVQVWYTSQLDDASGACGTYKSKDEALKDIENGILDAVLDLTHLSLPISWGEYFELDDDMYITGIKGSGFFRHIASDKTVHVDLDLEGITIREGNNIILHWDKQEWHDDPDLAVAIGRAIHLAHTNMDAIRHYGMIK